MGRVRSVLLLAVVTASIVTAWTAAWISPYLWLLFLFLPVTAARITERIERARRSPVQAG